MHAINIAKEFVKNKKKIFMGNTKANILCSNVISIFI